MIVENKILHELEAYEWYLKNIKNYIIYELPKRYESSDKAKEEIMSEIMSLISKRYMGLSIKFGHIGRNIVRNKRNIGFSFHKGKVYIYILPPKEYIEEDKELSREDINELLDAVEKMPSN